MTLFYIFATVGFVLYLTLVWLLSKLLHLSGPDFWLFTLSLAVIGIAATILTIVFFRRRQQKAQTQDAASDLESTIASLVREADSRLLNARQAGKSGRKISELPVMLFIGDQGSAKTSIITNSGLEPELLAGQVYQDNRVTATSVMNVWLANGTVFIEATLELIKDMPALNKLLKLVRGRTLIPLILGRSQPPRGIVLCCGCELFASSDANNEIAITARRYHEILENVAQNWGAYIPVYVMVTKTDQIGAGNESQRPFFTDYVRLFTPQEASQAFGVTLPLGQQEATGVYNEEQSRRLSHAFESLFGSLSDKRLECLRRENDPQRLPNIYEFPREFRKIRDNLIRFLVDVARPSQLRATPYLRGFYFTGVRPVVVTHGDSVEVPIEPNVSIGDAGATVVLSGARARVPASMAGQQPGARRVAEWVFLRQFFEKLILADASARTVSGRNTRVAFARRVLAVCASAMALLWLVGTTVSYFNNRDLIRRIDSSKLLAQIVPQRGYLPSKESLQELDKLRAATVEVTNNQRSRPALGFRWGIYPGLSLYEKTRTIYCANFERFLLADTRESLESYLHTLPATPRAGDDYELPFRSLKAYLLITQEAARTEPDFLAKTLLERWAMGRSAPPDLLALAQGQFAFYSAERKENLCGSTADPIAIARARQYLLNFQPEDQVYGNIIAAVSKQGAPIKFQDPSGAVAESLEIPFPYTKTAWSPMQDSIRNAVHYFTRDPWVLGNEQSLGTAMLGLQEKLKQHFLTEYRGKWQQFLMSASVPAYANLADAARKLDKMTSDYPLLRLFCTISVNTDVEATEIKHEFEAIQHLEPPATCTTKPNDAPTQQYIQELTRLAIKVDDVARLPDPSSASVETEPAKLAAKTTAQTLNLPGPALELLMKPILNLDKVLGGVGPAAINAKGSDFCKASANVFNSLPFKREAQRELRLEDFTRFFQPGSGQLTKFGLDLADLIIDDGSRFSLKSGSKYKVNPAFLYFMNRAAAIRSAFFLSNSEQPRLNYYVRVHPSSTIRDFVLDIDGKMIRGNSGPVQELSWNGDISKVHLEVATGTAITETGSWALFRFLGQANGIPSVGQNLFDYNLISSSQFGRGNRSTSAAGLLRLEVDSQSAKGIFSNVLGLECVQRIVQTP